MSSTNRGYERHKTDYYFTPITAIEKFMYEFQYSVLKTNSEIMGKLNWLDPCCGGDKNNPPAYMSVIKDFYEPKYLCGIDIREDSKADIVTNYLECKEENMDDHDIIISNPPFTHALEFINKSLEFVKEGGYVVMLLRLNFFGSKGRKEFFDTHMPEYCFVHSKRMNFFTDYMIKELKAKGQKVPSGDSIEYAHFVWKKGYNPEFTKLKVI